eukprot:TCONS_00062134-protein
MALPTIKPSWIKTYKSRADFSTKRIEKENQVRSTWSNHNAYFNKANNIVSKNDDWTSQRSKNKSLNAVEKLFNEIESKESSLNNLEYRRDKLRSLIYSEDEKYRKEIQSLRGNRYSSTEAMQEKLDALAAAKETKRKKEADEKLYEHWRQNEPRLRELESKRIEKNALGQWENQIQKKEEVIKTNFETQRKLDNYLKEENLRAQAEEIKKEEARKMKARMLAEEQQQQITELKRKESEADFLRGEEQKLIENEQLLEKTEAKRKLFDEQRKRQDYGMVLIRQYKQQLKRKSKQVQEALEHDLQLLKEINQIEKQEIQLKQDQKEERRKDAEFMQRVIEDQLRVEKIREAEVDQLYQQEANRQWRKRESEWEMERLARDRLINAVFQERQQQIQHKMEQIQQRKQESIMEREQLLEELEDHQRLTHRENEAALSQRKIREQELHEQITARESERQMQQRREMEDYDLEKLQEMRMNEMYSEEAKRIDLNSSNKCFRRKRVAFT